MASQVHGSVEKNAEAVTDKKKTKKKKKKKKKSKDCCVEQAAQEATTSKHHDQAERNFVEHSNYQQADHEESGVKLVGPQSGGQVGIMSDKNGSMFWGSCL